MPLGLGVKVDSITAVPGAPLEVWLVNETYVNAEGTPKTDPSATPAGAYVINWDAYKVGAGADATVKDAATAGNDKVLFAASTSTVVNDTRKKLTIGSDLLTAGVVVVVQVYKNGTAANAVGLGATKATGRVAEFTLTIAKDATTAIDLTNRTLSANGLAGAGDTDVTGTKVSAAANAITGVKVTLDSGKTDSATVKLSLAGTAATANQKVAFNNFALSGLAAEDGIEVTFTGKAESDTAGALNLLTHVSDGAAPDTVATATTAAKVSFAKLAPARVDFVAKSTGADGSGLFTLGFEDKYGRKATLVVTLDHKLG